MILKTATDREAEWVIMMCARAALARTAERTRLLWFVEFRKRSPSPKQRPMELVEESSQFSRKSIATFNAQHYDEKLRELVKRRKKPGL